MTLRVVRADDRTDEPRPPRGWAAKFREAAHGIKLGIRGQSSFFVHFFAATLVVTGAAILQCEFWEWCVLLGCIGLVLTAELFNSALEALFRGLDSAARDQHYPALHIAAGAVLAASATAAVIGLLVFGRRLWVLVASGL